MAFSSKPDATNILILSSLLYHPEEYLISSGIINATLTLYQTKMSLYPHSLWATSLMGSWNPHIGPFPNPPLPSACRASPCFPSRPRCLLCGHHQWFKPWWAALGIGVSCTPPVAHGHVCYPSCTVPHTPRFYTSHLDMTLKPSFTCCEE